MGIHEDAITQIHANAEVAAEQFSTTQAELFRAQSEVARLAAELEACQNPPSEPSALLGWNAEHPSMTARRWYYQWDNSRFSMEDEAITRLQSNVKPLNSLKLPSWSAVRVGQYDAAISEVVDELPDGVDHCTHHEPENDSGANPVDFCGAFDRVSGLLPLGVRHVVCLMGWTFDPRSGRRWQDWIPETAEMIALDRYNMFRSNSNPNAPWQTPEQLFDDAVLAIREAGIDLPISIWETNSYEDPNDPERKANWIHQAGDFTEQYGLEGLTFFDSRATQPNDFRLLSSDRARQAVEELAARPYFGR